MTVSIITVTYNSANTIRDTLESVKDQSYPHIEHIIIDGLSKDDTLRIVSEYPTVSRLISEPDKGIYDAMNKGIQIATGDIIGFLNSDDFFSKNDVIQTVVTNIKEKKVESVFGDVKFVDAKDIQKVVRYYSSQKFHPNRFAWGYMPAHPTFYTYKKNYENFGIFKTDYKICADYEILIRFLYSNKLSYAYIHQDLVTMRVGGVSNTNLKSRLILNKEIVRACRENGIQTNLAKVCLKIFSKLSELIFIPKSVKN